MPRIRARLWRHTLDAVPTRRRAATEARLCESGIDARSPIHPAPPCRR